MDIKVTDETKCCTCIKPSRNIISSNDCYATSGNNNSGSTIIPVQTTARPALSEKFRVQLNVAGFNPETIKTRVEGRKVIVEAKQEDRQGEGDFSIREIRKTYELPEYAGK